MNWGELIIQILVTVISYIIGTLFLKNYFTSYMSKKGENLATKEDLKELTTEQAIAQKQYELKYETCVAAMGVLDGVVAQVLIRNGFDDRVIPQLNDTAKARKVHNQIRLACEDPRIATTYLDVIVTPKDKKINRIERYDIFRDLVREELGFGKPIPRDPERVIIGRLDADPAKPLDWYKSQKNSE